MKHELKHGDKIKIDLPQKNGKKIIAVTIEMSGNSKMVLTLKPVYEEAKHQIIDIYRPILN